MSDASVRVLDRLAELNFEVRAGGVAPFGEQLPLVTGVAWETTTAQVAFVAEISPEDDVATWRQLLFAGSGLRHQLAGDGPAGFGTPVILAIVDDDGERRLRGLTEDLAQHYALFNRVDLNFVRRRDLDDDDRLDLALAPLLPRCRAMLGEEISKRDVQRFWNVLREEILRTALGLDDVFGRHREAAGHDIATALIGDTADATELPAPVPLTKIELQNFRSFSEAAIDLAPVSVVHGPNGSGKSSILEGLELAWAHRSQRQPDDVDANEYARHLPRDGSGEFVVRCGTERITSVAAEPRAELPRCVLAQETVANLVGSSPDERYSGLLTTTGLEIPDLKARTKELVAAAKREADAALVAVGLPPLPRSDSDGRKHLVNTVATRFAGRLPSSLNLVGLEQTLQHASGGAFAPRDWADEEVATALARVDERAAAVLTDLGEGVAVAETLDEARDAVRHLASKRESAARAARLLLDALSADDQPDTAITPDASSDERQAPAAIPATLAVRWLSHSRAVFEAAARFRSEAKGIDDEQWAQQLKAYADALEAAAEVTPRAALEPLTRATPTPRATRKTPARATAELYGAAGFSGAGVEAERIEAPLRELADELQKQAGVLDGLAAELAEHPARRFGEHAQRVLRAICRFEVARNLRREGPVMRASEELVRELLQGKLAPVLRELVAAIVRFEWYFKPLQVPESGRRLVLGGLSTSQPDLDARLVLNSAERNVLGVAWFLALHLLQPAERRRVLVLDDPTGSFDAVNQAGFVATLRAFARLTRPDQLVAVTHDDVLAAVLAEELAPVDDWPTGATRIRCQRDADDGSTATVEWSETVPRATGDETVILGLQGDTTLLA